MNGYTGGGRSANVAAEDEGSLLLLTTHPKAPKFLCPKPQTQTLRNPKPQNPRDPIIP